MPAFGKIWVMDREAYAERRAIAEVEGIDGLEASRIASDCGYNSRLGKVLTAAANDDWEPARAWCAEIAARFGGVMAGQVIQDIYDALDAELKWRR